MFKKNENKNTFGDKNHIMKDKYNTNKLVIAKLQRISSSYHRLGPMVDTTEQKYIFEKIIDKNNNIKYKEVFTGFTTKNIDDTEDDVDLKYFDIPYVYQPENFTDYYPETIGIEIPKLSLIWTLNDINFPKKMDKEKVIQLNKIKK